jgi:hypothetical protein
MTRKEIDRAKLDAVSRSLREMFQAVESMPVPDRLMSIIDQLDDGSDTVVEAPRRVANRRATSG